MIGNSYKEDIKPSEMAGLYSFFMSDGLEQNIQLTHPLSQQGNINEILPWLTKIMSETASFPILSPEALVVANRVTPAAVDTLVKSLTEKFHQKAAAAINAAAAFDRELSDIVFDNISSSNNLNSACTAFFESREQLTKFWINSSQNLNREEIFRRDRVLLRFLISLQS
jgi:hypothetical protein